MQTMPTTSWVHRVASDTRSAGRSVREIADVAVDDIGLDNIGLDIGVLLAAAPGPVQFAPGLKRRESAPDKPESSPRFNASNFVQVPGNSPCASRAKCRASERVGCGAASGQRHEAQEWEHQRAAEIRIAVDDRHRALAFPPTTGQHVGNRSFYQTNKPRRSGACDS